MEISQFFKDNHEKSHEWLQENAPNYVNQCLEEAFRVVHGPKVLVLKHLVDVDNYFKAKKEGNSIEFMNRGDDQ